MIRYLISTDTQQIWYTNYSEYIESIIVEWATMTNIPQQDDYIYQSNFTKEK